MARRKRPETTRVRRDHSSITNDLSLSVFLPTQGLTPMPTPLRQVEDRREWHPDPYPPAREFRRSKARLDMAQPKRRSTSLRRSTLPLKAERLSFVQPAQVPICVRRKQRREVLLALGRGGGRHRPPRRNRWSNVRC